MRDAGPQAYNYASGRPLVNADPDGRFVVDWRSLSENCCGRCESEGELKKNFENAMGDLLPRGRNTYCSQYFDPDGFNWIFGDGSGPYLDFDTEARYRERYAFAAEEVESFNAFTYLHKVHVTCERVKNASTSGLSETLIHEGWHTNQPMFMLKPKRHEGLAFMLGSCGY